MKTFQKCKNLPAKNAKVLLLTHIDADGSGASIVFRAVFDDITVRYCSNGFMSENIRKAVCEEADKYDYIIACDISCNAEDAEAIDRSNGKKKFVLLDHHISAIDLNKYDWAIVKPEITVGSFRHLHSYNTTHMLKDGHSSGASLAYDFAEYAGLIPAKSKYSQSPALERSIYTLQELVTLIAGYDTWDWVNLFNKDREYKDINTLFGIYGQEMFEERFLNKVLGGEDIFDETDYLLLKIESEKINSYLKRTEKGFKTGTLTSGDTEYSAVFVSANDYLADVFARMQEVYPGYDLYVASYGTGISVRATKPEINVGEIVKKVGGGGHAGAGGIKIKQDIILNLIGNTIGMTLTVDKEKEGKW